MRIKTTVSAIVTCDLTESQEEMVRDYAKRWEVDFAEAVYDLIATKKINPYDNIKVFDIVDTDEDVLVD